jgi:hypothetical protein
MVAKLSLASKINVGCALRTINSAMCGCFVRLPITSPIVDHILFADELRWPLSLRVREIRDH